MTNTEFVENFFRYRSGLVILPEQAKVIGALLDDLTEKLPARSIMLADASGELIASRGEINPSQRAHLGALIAGDLGVSRELSMLTGDYTGFDVILREGKNSRILITSPHPKLALFVQTQGNTPLGWIFLTLKRASATLAECVEISASNEARVTDSADLPAMLDSALDAVWK